MDIGTISLVLLVGMLALLAIGMPLGFASGFLAVVVMVMKFGPELLLSNFGTGPLNILAQRMYGLTTDYVLISVPLFILMATLLERSGIARDMYSSLSVWLNRTRGGIALVTSLMAVVMAAMSGIIGGEVVLLGLIALPQMLRLGYDQNLAIGTICASGSLGTMIPPSIVLIFYGLITETSIHALFKGAFVPGFILASCYMLYIIVRTRLNPGLAPLPEPGPDDMTGAQKRVYGSALLSIIAILVLGVTLIRSGFLISMGRVDEHTSILSSTQMMTRAAIIAGLLAYLAFFVRPARIRAAWDVGKGLIAPMLVVGVVLGSIYGGITGITEAAGMGTFAVLVLIILRGEFSWTLVREALMRTFKSTGTIIWVTFGATALAGAYTIAGGPTYVANLIVGYEMPTLGVLAVMMIIFLFLGAFMDWVGIVLLVMPVFLPIVLKLPIEEIGVFAPLVADPRFLSVWFGILFCVNMQVSFLSPPFGPAAFYLKSVAPPHISLPDIFRGFLPFIAIQLFVLMLILFFPELTMFFR
ncbi:TRAP transporter large permease subunit [Sedimentitalea sp. JM2-8]|uniref:TRAP transporter large permease subunit n=1 Tax=Sedimentitalea xiamensis TaxID=3050037 RepID=A0ABT7FAY3_9RHOB|nr:TRAP transporter large permease subunit [Sedimentitalea xiamensis]MDK3072279.1 TRAP transporter large permease subunit [Sedimentitalea xiamensis]